MSEQPSEPGTESVEHYFSTQPAGEFTTRLISVRIAGRDVQVETASGIFSPDHIDDGTKVLLDEAPTPPASGDLLDIGCGWGPIALTLATESPNATVWAVDVNERSLELTRRNAARLGLNNVRAVRPEDVPSDVQFAQIWSNPPIRIGKDALHELLQHWLPRLAPGAEAWLVVQKNLGADSLHAWMNDEFAPATIDRAAVGKGFRVLRYTSP
ncbi:MAG: class I SAM-dependent methyltransferase [Microbacteriaceae bacterium]